jgi:penicillin amidase
MKRSLTALALLVAAAAGGRTWYLDGKQPQRDGELILNGLQAPVTVRFDERGVPHIRAEHEADLYRALGYVHAQDRLFQMEMLRRLARGELAEILGAKLVDSDRLFRTLGIRQYADHYAANLDSDSASSKALQAYLDGINQYQDNHPAPLEFDLLGIDKRPFSVADVISVSGYMAYSFAAAFRTEPVLSYVRDELGADYLQVFDLGWQPEGALHRPLAKSDWRDLGAIAQLSSSALADAGLPQFEGSNAWAVSGSRTASGKPLLAGDPHIRFAAPAVWYEAHLQAPGFELYGYHLALTPVALLGHNRDFAWSITMFQNDDVDLIAERVNPDNPEQVWNQGRWVDLQSRQEQIKVKDGEPVTLTLRRSPHGPIINDALSASTGETPIALWWAFTETENPMLDAFYRMNRADSLDLAAAAAQRIEAPGLNVIWANASGDIGWWASAKLPRRPDGVNPAFILDGASGEGEKLGYYPFSANPQETNPERGYIVSANFQPPSQSGIAFPGYYNLADRGQRLDERLADASVKWDVANSQALQLDTGTAYGPRLLAPILDELRAAAEGPQEQALIEQLASWNGDHNLDSVVATLFNQLLYQLTREAMADELGDSLFDNLLQTRVLDSALPRLTADAESPWWNRQDSEQPESRAQIVADAWRASLEHLRSQFGDDPSGWSWSRAHTLTHGHPLGQQALLAKLLNIGPFAAPGGHEMPNNLSHKVGPAPWPVVYGPSTRRLVDLADAERALGGLPVGQSGVPFDAHYGDQAAPHVAGGYQPQHLSEADVAAHSRGTLRLLPH